MGKECCFRLSRGGRDEKRVPLKTPAWDTKRYRAVSLQPPRVFRIFTERLFPTILEPRLAWARLGSPGLAEASRYPPGGRYLPRFSFGCLPATKWASGFLLAAKCKLMQIDQITLALSLVFMVRRRWKVRHGLPFFQPFL